MATEVADAPVSTASFSHLRTELTTSGVDFFVAVIDSPAFAVVLVKGSTLAQLRLTIAQALTVLSLFALLFAGGCTGLLLLFTAGRKEALGARLTLGSGSIALHHLGLYLDLH